MTKSTRVRAQSKKISRDLKENGDIANDVTQELGHGCENARECGEQGQIKIRGAARTFEQYVRERPVNSVLIAVGVGVPFGRFGIRR